MKKYTRWIIFIQLIIIPAVTIYSSGAKISCVESGENCRFSYECGEASYGIDCWIRECRMKGGTLRDFDCNSILPSY
jgi:hypothetical protein